MLTPFSMCSQHAYWRRKLLLGCYSRYTPSKRFKFGLLVELCVYQTWSPYRQGSSVSLMGSLKSSQWRYSAQLVMLVNFG